MSKYGHKRSDYDTVSEKEAKKLDRTYNRKNLPNVDKNMPSWVGAQLKKAEADKEASDRRRGQEVAKGWADKEARDKKALRDAERASYNKIKGDTPSNTGHKGVNYSGGDYF